MALRAECLYTPTERDGPGDPGYQLHSAELSFRHPRSGHALGSNVNRQSNCVRCKSCDDSFLGKPKFETQPCAASAVN